MRQAQTPAPQSRMRAEAGATPKQFDVWLTEELVALAADLDRSDLADEAYRRIRRLEAYRSAPRFSDFAQLVDAGVPAAAVVALLAQVAEALQERGAQAVVQAETLSLAVVTRESAEGVAASALVLEQPDCEETLTRAAREALDAREAWDRRYRWLCTQRRRRRAGLSTPPSMRAGRAARRLHA